MATTYYPQLVQGLPPTEFEITWRTHPSGPFESIAGLRYQTASHLIHLSNPACGDLRSSTQALSFTNFNITGVPEVISGIVLQVNTQRNGRATDEIIQLTYQGVAIGTNHVDYYTDTEGHLTLDNSATYGSSTDTWGVDLTPAMLQNPSFGVILKFQSHPYYPHSSGMFIDSVSLTVY
jgi:hypothetical protein